MSSPRWTKEQQAVIDSRGGNLLVAAAAGSGKTAVLVQRIINMITDPIKPIDIDTLLVVTFTNAAATEMKERVQNALEKLIESDPGNTQLKRQLTLLEKANITTVHSFCLNIIKEYFFKLNLSSDFKIGSEQELALLKIKTMDEVFEKLYKEKNEDFYTLINQFGTARGDSNLRELLLSMYHFVISAPNPQKWLNDVVDDFNIREDFKFLETDSGKILIETIKIEFEGVLQSFEQAINQIEEIPELFQYRTKYENELYEFRKVYASFDKGWNEIKYTIDNIVLEDYRKGMKRLPKTTDEYIKTLQKSTKKIRDNCKDSVINLGSEIFYRNEEDIKNEYKKLYVISKSLSDILIRFMNKYQDYKKESNIIDFNDIEHFAIKLLTDEVNGELVPSEIAKLYSCKFEEIFIDEYQDSNLTQELLLTSISKNNENRFMVGDLKQSIYKFRQAKPEIFLEKYNSYSTDLNQISKKILLHKNFRSRKEVLDATNFIFEHIMRSEVGGLDYGVEERLNLGGHFKENNENKVIVGGPAELHLISKLDTNEDNFDSTDEIEKEDLDKIQQEARVIGNIIKDLFIPNENGEVFKVIDKKSGDYRNVRFSDIVILLRSISNWQEIIAEELGKMGIPVEISSATGYLDSFEIRTSIVLLKAINNPYDDISLVGALRTICFDFTMDELASLKNEFKHLCFYEALKEYSEKDDDLSVKCKTALSRINDFIRFSRKNSIYDTLNYIYSETEYYTFISALQNGEVRVNNIELLLERAYIFSKENECNIGSFIEYIENLREQDLDLEGYSAVADSSDSVKIMTIHKSKGLEFPVVICAGMGKQFNTMDLKNPFLYHMDLGYGPQIVDVERKITYPSIKKEALKRKMHLETLAEEIRILYVALTRPKEKLIITGMVNNLESNMEKWGGFTYTENALPAYSILKASNYLDWIVPSLLKHRDFKDLCLDYNIEDVVRTEHESEWTYKVWDSSDIPEVVLKKMSDENTENIKDDNLTLDTILNNLVLESPQFEQYSSTPKAFSITDFVDIVNKKENTKSTLLLPDIFEEEKCFSAAEIGTIFHEAMQKIDFKNIHSLNDVYSEIDRLVKNGLLLDKEAAVLNKRRIWKFIDSQLGKRIKSSKDIKREQPISIYIDDKYSLPEINNLNSLLINGVIDIYFEEEDGLVIVDYKTDYVDEANINSIIKDYSIQLKLYKEALERTTNKKVKECYLHLFSKEESIKII